MKNRELFIATIFFLLGAFVMYLYNLNSIHTKQVKMARIYEDFKKTSATQDELKNSYARDYMSFIKCSYGEGDCEDKIFEKNLQKGVKEREELYKKLEKLNVETQKLGDELNI